MGILLITVYKGRRKVGAYLQDAGKIARKCTASPGQTTNLYKVKVKRYE